MYTLGGKGAQRKTMSRFTQFAIISVVLGALAAAQETPAPAAPPGTARAGGQGAPLTRPGGNGNMGGGGQTGQAQFVSWG